MYIKLLVITLIVVAIAVFFLGIRIFLFGKKFPHTHIGGNKEMRKRGIVCAQSLDRIERKKVKKELETQNFNNMKLLTDEIK